ncbi:putative sulfatase atsG [Lunatimonas lonarensis]|uniref:Putative sulfatase atsG n=1 Tax=Lunatimonas lonarensis TaxID=1232681 RepID=R7ZVX7_9BACT|nr:sulfatase [Lunatimonas lonarensis]EON78144.1 putative sulfatase atsG [Lunatimonas lonarensis]
MVQKQIQRFVFFAVQMVGASFLYFSCAEKEEVLPPNFLFAIMDDTSFPHMGAYGTEWVITPAFDRVAKEGILFTRAYTPNAKCAPSRSSILTGRNSWQLEEAANHVPFFPEKFGSFVELLGEKGFHTGFTGKGWAPGKPGMRDGKPRLLTGKGYQAKTLEPPTAFISKNDYTANFEDFLNDREPGKPFFFWYGSTEPHRAYEFQSGVNKGRKQLSDLEKVPGFWPDIDTVRHDMLDYAFEIEYFDKHLAQMIALLEERGELDRTVIIITSDNGMPFPRVKGNPYEMSHHMPLAIMWPKGIKSPGRVVDDFISFIDFAPTILELAEVDPAEGMAPITGRSFSDVLFSEKEGLVSEERNRVLIGQERHDVGRPNDVGYPVRGIVTEEYLYLHNFETDRWPAGNPETGYLNTDGSPTKTTILERMRANRSPEYWFQSFGKRPQEELYHRLTDPECIHNLAEHPEYQSLKENLKTQLFDQLRAEDDPRMFGRGDLFDAYLYAEDATANFYERFLNGEKLRAGWVNESDFEPKPLE